MKLVEVGPTINGIEACNFKLHGNPLTVILGTREKKGGSGQYNACGYNTPLAVPFPHFFNADLSLLKPFEGLDPNESKRGTVIALYPQLAIPMGIKPRLPFHLRGGSTSARTTSIIGSMDDNAADYNYSFVFIISPISIYPRVHLYFGAFHCIAMNI
ncbi:hypothetical protein GQX74_015028 [Glossina fuscipes]|nr:hypothetical protein GQX74_015028 [Glossina fuscipes]